MLRRREGSAIVPVNKSPRLILSVHGEPALRLNPAGGRFASDDAAEWLSAADRLSCGWNAPLDMFSLGHWLEHLLPEGGMLAAARTKAAETLLQHDVRREPSGAGDVLWGNPGPDCPGAVSIVSEFEDGDVLAPPRTSSAPVSDNQVGSMVRWAVQQASNKGPLPIRPTAMSTSSLAGFRPKIGLHHAPVEQRWFPATAERLSTHIVKYEDHADLPGEAVAETVALRALNLAGVPAAFTVARVFGGAQCVVSRRTDRTIRDCEIVPAHQEDWGQAACMSTREKFHHQTVEPGWPALVELLRTGGFGRDDVDAVFIRMLVGCMLLAHTDLHRQNVGIISRPDSVDGQLFHLAPLYDVSCADGRPGSYSRMLALPVGQATTPESFDAGMLLQLADACGMDRDLAVNVAMDVVEQLPGAVAQAKRTSIDHDEARVPEDARARLEAMAQGVESRSARLRFDMAHARRPTLV